MAAPAVIPVGSHITKAPKENGIDRFYHHYQHIIYINIDIKKYLLLGFPGGAVVESLPANAGDTGSGPGLGGSRVPRSD